MPAIPRMPAIDDLYLPHVLRLSPSHFPTFVPAPGNVERVMTSVLRPGRRADIASCIIVDIMCPYRLCVSYSISPFACSASVYAVLSESAPDPAWFAIAYGGFCTLSLEWSGAEARFCLLGGACPKMGAFGSGGGVVRAGGRFCFFACANGSVHG